MIDIRKVQENDKNAWCNLYKEYLEFYNTFLNEEQLQVVWNWISEYQIYCYVAVQENQLVGFVHFREFLRPIRACKGVFMDDLFIKPLFRRNGIGLKLIKAVEIFAHRNNISTIRWITHLENHQAIAVYNKISSRTKWVTYDLVIE